MSSLEIPKWTGPVLTPIVLILLIAVVCFYYCYWKPRRERKKKANEADDKREKKKMISPSAPARHHSTESVKQQSYPYDEEICYGGYYDCEGYTLTGPYYMDYCPLPGNGLSFCTQYNCKPTLVYYPNASRHAKSREMGYRESWCKDVEKMRKCRVKCPRGECIKCPDLPMITEGDSTPSLCEVEEENEQKNPCNLEDTDITCACHDDDDDDDHDDGGDDHDHEENQEKLETKRDSVGDNTSSCCRDSGYED